MLLTDGILCMDPGCLHITLLDSLRNKGRRCTYSDIMRTIPALLAQLVPGSWSLVNLQFNKPTCFTFAFSALSSLSHFLELRCSSLAANLRLNKCSVWLVKGWFILVMGIQLNNKTYILTNTQPNSVWARNNVFPKQVKRLRVIKLVRRASWLFFHQWMTGYKSQAITYQLATKPS